jgi:hypothetical protein
MGIVIHVYFGDRSRITVEATRKLLGDQRFDEAMVMPMEELEKIACHPQAFLTEIGDAYLDIYNFRRSCMKQPCPVIKLAA